MERATDSPAGEPLRIVVPAVTSDDEANAFWRAEVEPALAHPPKAVVVVLPTVRPMHLPVFAALAALAHRVETSGGTITFEGEDDRFKSFFRWVEKRPQAVEAPARAGWVEQVGRSTLATLATMAAIVLFATKLVGAVAALARRPTSVRWRDFLAAAASASLDALPVTLLLTAIVGFIIAFQTMPSFRQFGAPNMVGIVIGVAMVRELGPLITAIILGGRSGSAFAAELGTMTVTNEIDALRALDLDPIRYLVLPRILALLVVTPLLSVLATIAGLLGGYLVLWENHISFLYFYDQVRGAVHPHDFLQGIVKMAVFSLLVGSAGCLAGLETAEGPGAVGRSATRAVVASIVLVILADGVMGAIFYTIGW